MSTMYPVPAGACENDHPAPTARTGRLACPASRTMRSSGATRERKSGPASGFGTQSFFGLARTPPEMFSQASSE